jgi:hypothetical protein
MSTPAATPTLAAASAVTQTAAPAAATVTVAPVLWKGREVHMGKVDLTEALTSVLGDLSKLPELKWEWVGRFTYDLKQISWSDLTNPAMVLKEKDKLVGVAVKYFDDAYPKDSETRVPAYIIKIFAITNRFNEQKKEVSVEGPAFAQAQVLHYSVQSKITAAEGEKLEAKFPKVEETK